VIGRLFGFTESTNTNTTCVHVSAMQFNLACRPIQRHRSVAAAAWYVVADTDMNDDAVASFLLAASSRSVGADLLSYCFFSATSRIHSDASSTTNQPANQSVSQSINHCVT
jgi:hypothetical protein